MDKFGHLSLQPYRGKGWFQQRRPNRLRATYTRPHGVRHLLAALDLKTNKLYGHASKTKKHADIFRFFNVLRGRFHRSERLYIILDNIHTDVCLMAKSHRMSLCSAPEICIGR
ncbi:hypothetical protein [Paenibacillus solanacearum]|uniref:hypothetical protein n=1 Tax=Paenibacillus solanacearum TaxID=2048548 RepID=UPI001C404F80|nr:hypothetical protein [Paenibacillus solanacearum]